MADNYVTTGSYLTPQVLANGDVIDAEIVSFTTKPHGVHSQVVVPLTAWKKGEAGAYIEPVAKNIETIMHDKLATGATVSQDVNPLTQQLVSAMVFTVVYEPKGTDRSFSATASVPLSELAKPGGGTALAELRATRASLEHTASL